MIAIENVLLIFMVISAVSGTMRRASKEILVSFAVVFGMFVITLIETYLPPVQDMIKVSATDQAAANTVLSIRMVIFTLAVFFGYQTPQLPLILQRGAGRLASNRMQNILLGFFLGFINGFLIVGSIWWFIDQARYPFPQFISPALSETARTALVFLPPVWLMTVPLIFIAVAVALGIVLIVFL